MTGHTEQHEAGERGHDWWLAIAKSAGKHGIRYRTNSALEAFLADVAAATPNTQPAGDGIKALRVDWNKFDLAEAYDLVEGVRRAAAQNPESGIDSALRNALDAIESADCEWDGLTEPVAEGRHVS